MRARRAAAGKDDNSYIESPVLGSREGVIQSKIQVDEGVRKIAPGYIEYHLEISRIACRRLQELDYVAREIKRAKRNNGDFHVLRVEVYLAGLPNNIMVGSRMGHLAG